MRALDVSAELTERLSRAAKESAARPAAYVLFCIQHPLWNVLELSDFVLLFKHPDTRTIAIDLLKSKLEPSELAPLLEGGDLAAREFALRIGFREPRRP
jgi:hypothetical protein